MFPQNPGPAQVVRRATSGSDCQSDAVCSGNDASTAHLEEDLWEQRSQNEWWYDRQNVWRLLLLTRWELQQNRKSSVLAHCSWSRYHACQGQDDIKGSGWCIP